MVGCYAMDTLELVIFLKRIGAGFLLDLTFFRMIPRMVVEKCLKLLRSYGVLGGTFRLTQGFGAKSVMFPLDLLLSLVLMASMKQGCSLEAAGVVAMMTVLSLSIRM